MEIKIDFCTIHMQRWCSIKILGSRNSTQQTDTYNKNGLKYMSAKRHQFFTTAIHCIFYSRREGGKTFYFLKIISQCFTNYDVTIAVFDQ